MAVSGLRKTCSGAMLVTTVFILQASSIFIPVLGFLLSASSTLFIGAAGMLMKRQAILVYLCASLLLLLLSPRYAAEFLLTTGFSGLSLGLLMDKNRFLGFLLSSLGMTSGLAGITGFFGAAAFGGAFLVFPAAGLPGYLVFSLSYCFAWLSILKRFARLSLFRRYAN